MAIVSKTNRDGIDTVVEQLQQYTYPNLLGFWAGGIVYESYPRANKNHKQESVIPQLSLDQKDYKEVLMDDKKAITSFFVADDVRTFNDATKQYKQTIHMIFQADLVKLYGDTERVDEVFNMDVHRVIKKENVYIVGDVTMTEGIDNVYADFTFNPEMQKKIDLHDMSQFHVLKVSFEVLYRDGCSKVVAPVCPSVGLPVTTSFNAVPTGVDTPDGDNLAIAVTNSTPALIGTLAINTANQKGITIADTTIRNSDDTYSDSAPAENTYTIGDVPWTDSDGSPQTTPYNSPIICTPSASAISYVRDSYIVKEGTTNLNGDVEWYLANTSVFTYNVNGIRPILDPNDSTLLLTLNIYGNYLRLTNDKGGSNFVDVGGGLTSDGATAGYAVDNYTGLGVPLDALHAGTEHWEDSFATAQAHTMTAYDGSTYGNDDYGQFRMWTYEDVVKFCVNDGLNSHIFSSIKNWSDLAHYIMYSVNATTIMFWRENVLVSATNRYTTRSSTSAAASIDLLVCRNHF